MPVNLHSTAHQSSAVFWSVQIQRMVNHKLTRQPSINWRHNDVPRANAVGVRMHAPVYATAWPSPCGCLSAARSWSTARTSAQMLLGGLRWQSPPLRLPAEQSAWTWLWERKAKHHQFVSRQRVPGGWLPSCKRTRAELPFIALSPAHLLKC